MTRQNLLVGLVLGTVSLTYACSGEESQAAQKPPAPAPAEKPAPTKVSAPLPSPNGYRVTVNGLSDEQGWVRIRRAPEEEKDGSLVILVTAVNVQALAVRGRGQGFVSMHDFLGDDEIKIEFTETEKDPYPVNVYERTEEGWSEAVWTGTQTAKTLSDDPEWSLDTWRSDEVMASGIDLHIFEYRHGSLLYGFQLAGEVFGIELID